MKIEGHEYQIIGCKYIHMDMQKVVGTHTHTHTHTLTHFYMYM